MSRKTVSGIMFALLLIGMLTLAYNIQPVKSEPETWTVDDDGPADFHTIQEAINAASPEDTIFVYNGTYSEPQVTIDKPLQLIGENKGTTIIDGGGSWVCVYVKSTNNVNITEFTIQNGYGIYLFRSENVTISGNIISNNGQGIILIESTNNTVSKNIVTLNGAISILLSGSNNNKICENIVKLNSGDGVWLDNSHENIVSGNNVSRNGLGTALGYHAYGIRLSYSNNNTIYHNYIMDNYEQASGWRSVNNTWDSGYPSGGNYWSDYTGVDVKGGPNQDQPSSDGIGDTPYVIDANSTDHYPLMNPWGAPAPPSYTLTIYSSPTGVTFTVDGVPRTTLWSGTYSEGASVSLVMPEIHTVGDARYYWNQWSDGNTSRSRTVTMNINITLTAYFTGPYYELTVNSSPITGITFTINGTPQTTPYTEWLPEDSYTLVMPETHNGYVWSHWLEDGDTNRTKAITLPGTTWTGVYVPAPLTPTDVYAWISIISAITSTTVSVAYVNTKKKKQI